MAKIEKSDLNTKFGQNNYKLDWNALNFLMLKIDHLLVYVI